MLVSGIFLAPLAQSQRQFQQSKELGLALGTAYYLGDINPGNHLGGRLSAGFGGYYRHNLSTRIAIRVNYFNCRIEAWDADSRDEWQQNRNLHFRNDIGELAALVEINYLDHQLGNAGDRFTAFLYGGIGVYNHMPEAEIDGQWIPLQPLGTEGQGTSWAEANSIDSYGTTGVSLPIGFGFKSNLGPFATFCFDWGVRKTWTDYLDDVSGIYADREVLMLESGPMTALMSDRSEVPEGGNANQAGLQRGDPSRSDVYGFLSASLSFRISKRPSTCWSYD
ncbi:MAG: DUF6089 family protein [Bacteroidetes bacterium]|nr:DUF6089 family protein [Bacteroidota bacterium]